MAKGKKTAKKPMGRRKGHFMNKFKIARVLLVLACFGGAVAVGADDPAQSAAGGGQSADASKGEAQKAAAENGASAAAVIDKAAAALGGKDKLAAVKVATWTSKGTITLGGTDAPFTATLTFQGHDRRRVEFETDFGGNAIKGVVVINGEKGWRGLNGTTEELAGNDLVNERRNGWREWTPVDVLVLKSPPFKTESAPDADVNGKPAAGVKVTGPEGAPFTIYFDKASGLPVRLVATVTTFTGEEAAEEVNYSDYKDFDGIKKATKVETKHDGKRLLLAEVTTFKVPAAADAKAFERPE
jgi:hypothetical protein